MLNNQSLSATRSYEVGQVELDRLQYVQHLCATQATKQLIGDQWVAASKSRYFRVKVASRMPYPPLASQHAGFPSPFVQGQLGLENKKNRKIYITEMGCGV